MTFINSLVIIGLIFFIVYIFNKCKLIFPIIIPFVLNVLINVISCAYIEEGIYVVDINTTSYMTGSTIRLAALNFVFLLTLVFLYKKNERIITRYSFQNVNEDKIKFVLWCGSFFVAYLLLDILISGSILTNPSITRFNYYSQYSSLPVISIFSSLRYAISCVCGLAFVSSGKKKYKFHAILNLISLIMSWYFVGNQFTGILYTIIYFAMPILVILLNNKTNIVNFKNIFLVVGAFIISLIPKLSYFQNHGVYGLNGTIYNSAFALLMYRAFGLQSALWWEIDRQVWGDKFNDIKQIENEVLSLFSSTAKEKSGVYYLMEKAMPYSEYRRYIDGGGTLCAGHPGIEICTVGYLGAAILMIIEAVFFFVLIKMLCKSIIKNNYLDCLVITSLLYETMKIFTVGGIFWIGNTIPVICILYLLVNRVFKIRIRFRNFKVKL
ncbi:DUF6418 domain-containing protein [Lacrimispora sp.]|uniref:DUF6418 domain-containing protein n=1 Tax=Lacrimispora sp. TaxID=2719234 RepID=UPI00289694D2|nr:DUF6418 domain-containing protein [Lacrimispora sp.]